MPRQTCIVKTGAVPATVSGFRTRMVIERRSSSMRWSVACGVRDRWDGHFGKANSGRIASRGSPAAGSGGALAGADRWRRGLIWPGGPRNCDLDRRAILAEYRPSGQFAARIGPAHARGRLVRVSRTEGGQREVWTVRHEYSFRLPDGRTVHGASFTNRMTARSRDTRFPPEEGTELTVEYDPHNPRISRIRRNGGRPFSRTGPSRSPSSSPPSARRF